MKRLALLSLMIFLAPLPVFAQQAANATLTGTVADQHGALVPGVKITATHVATGAKRETTTNSDGIYVFSNMSPGDYELRIEARGFSTKVTKTPVPLKVGQTVTLDVPLEIDVNEKVVIDLETYRPLIDNSGSLINSVIESREVESLPLNGRNFLELAFLVPGNVPAPNFDPTKTNTVVISSAG